MNTWIEIKKLIDAKFESDTAFAKAIGVDKNIVYSWNRGLSKSYLKHIDKIADELAISSDELLGRDQLVTTEGPYGTTMLLEFNEPISKETMKEIEEIAYIIAKNNMPKKGE